MLVIKNQEDLRKHQNKMPKSLFKSVEIDVKTIETEYDNVSDQYGPLVVVMYKEDRESLYKMFPLIKELDTEDVETIEETKNWCIKRELYLMGDNGYVVYVVNDKRMFQRNLYITRGINESLPRELINILWLKVQEVKNRELDYLQVFKIEKMNTATPALKITWSQEVPNHEEEFTVNGLSTEIEKVWIICTGEGTVNEYSTMLLPEEY